jgi:hypothetical protein
LFCNKKEDVKKPPPKPLYRIFLGNDDKNHDIYRGPDFHKIITILDCLVERDSYTELQIHSLQKGDMIVFNRGSWSAPIGVQKTR